MISYLLPHVLCLNASSKVDEPKSKGGLGSPPPAVIVAWSVCGVTENNLKNEMKI